MTPPGATRLAAMVNSLAVRVKRNQKNHEDQSRLDETSTFSLPLSFGCGINMQLPPPTLRFAAFNRVDRIVADFPATVEGSAEVRRRWLSNGRGAMTT
jgi:hypothetical protein